MRRTQLIFILSIATAIFSLVAVVASVRGATALVVVVGVLLFVLAATLAILAYLAARAEVRQHTTVNAQIEAATQHARWAAFNRMPPASGGPRDY